MSDQKISELTNITGANLADADEFVVVDVSADQTKAITLGELKEAFDTGSGFVRITGDTMTGNLTVPTADINGGTLDDVVIGSAVANTAAFTGLDLAAIAATKADTAVDVFVYDTSKDSDGGAWRKRTQGTSWYNETLNTAIRGSRREFPAVAVIVSEATNVTIYDGDDPALPMWMVFQSGTTKAMHPSSPRIAMLNAQLVAGGNLYDVNRIDFIGDRVGNSVTSPSRAYIGNIAQRNANLDYGVAGTASWFALSAIISRTVNDVAMTVLPDAPIDPATGLPVPTIAVATDGGVSVITDSGDVWDWTGGGLNPASEVMFDDLNRLHANRKTSSPNHHIFDTAAITVDNWASLYAFTSTTTPALGTSATNAGMYLADMGGGEFAFAKKGTYLTSDGCGLIDVGATVADSRKVMLTSSYNTGWMNGNIKLATLSDTDATNVTGAELVTNGTFTGTGNVTGWTLEGTAINNNGVDVFDVTAGAATNVVATQTIALTIGETYTISFERITGTNDCSISAAGAGLPTLYTNVVGVETRTFVATATSAVFLINTGSGSTKAIVDNITVRLAEEDRSVNGNGLQVFGTVTRNPVATGADLVAYSGFSATNYLEQPYNSDLDFGTGDFSIMGWVKHGTSATQCVAMRQDPSAPSGFGSGASYRFQLYAGNVAMMLPTSSLILSYPTANVGWVHLTWLRRNGVLSIYANGNLLGSSANTDSLTNTSAITRVGILEWDGTLTDAFIGSIALLRISATAPTAEQITKIYEDEKVLFQENAQATLYGTSDAVTALAHDDATGLLHVGTSAGRSVFQGLRRVSNTTTAVGTAISASNGLVVEE